MLRVVVLTTLLGSAFAQQLQLVTNYSGSALYVPAMTCRVTLTHPFDLQLQSMELQGGQRRDGFLRQCWK